MHSEHHDEEAAKKGKKRKGKRKAKRMSKEHKVMREFKRGKLKSGSGKTVKSRKQAIAIALSEARHGGGFHFD